MALATTLALTALLLGADPANDLPEAASAYAFAEALLSEGDHYRAITEYKRYLFLAPQGPNADAARMSIGLAYLRGGQAEAAADHFRGIADQVSEPVKPDALLQVGYAQYVGNQPALAYISLSQWLPRWGQLASEASRSRAHYLLGWSDLELENDPDALEEIEAAAFEAKPQLIAAVRDLNKLPHKSPVVAGLLSIIPGAGHVYIGQPWIGVTAFLWNGLFAYALYDTARRGQTGAAVVIGVFELLWYTGAIFGAVSGAMKFNRDARRNALDDLHARFDDRPESWPPAPEKKAPAP